jgi:YD repeat-containing protein
MSTTSYTYAPGCAAKTSTQTTGSRYGFEYGYNLAGALTAEKYPSGRVVQMSYDAVGRPTAVCNGTCAGSDKYASGITYAKYGLPTSMTLGNGVPETRDYNNRLQVTTTAVGTLWSLTNSYAAAPSNNGNVMGQTISGSAVTGATRSYGYDSLNRLGSASQSAWSETYSYDRFGNRAATRAGTLPGLVSGGETATLLLEVRSCHQPAWDYHRFRLRPAG